MYHDNPNGDAPLRDVQSSTDSRGIPLRQAGIRGLRYPMTVWEKDGGPQRTIGSFRLTVNLPAESRGTHMSRFLSAIEQHLSDRVNLDNMAELLDDLRSRLDAETAHVRIDFPYFIRRRAPVTNLESWLELRAWFVGEAEERDARFTLGVEVPVMTLCPCSKEISAYGAHCQRSYVRMSVRANEMVWIEDLLAYADASASAPIFPLLKRPDEKWVTETSYENPVFVEDLVRNVVEKLRDDPRITWFFVEAENEESIHTHNAYASLYSSDLSIQSPQR